MSPRHALLALLLAATLAAAFWPGDGEDGADVESGLVEAVQRPSRPSEAKAVPELTTNPSVEAEAAGDDTRFAEASGPNLFPVQSFRPPPKPLPPPTPVALPPPPPPMAPPVPFKFVGSWSEDGRRIVFLERGSQLITAQVGETLPGGWRLDGVDPEGLSFTYVSLNQQRTLRTGP